MLAAAAGHPRQRERGPLAGASSWQQPLLDLGGQAERPAALTPLEQVRVPTVGDDDEGQRVGHLADLRHDLVSWLLGQMHSSRPIWTHPARSPGPAPATARGEPRSPGDPDAGPASSGSVGPARPAPRQRATRSLTPQSSRRSPAANGVTLPRVPPASGTCANRTGARPDSSAIRKDTHTASNTPAPQQQPAPEPRPGQPPPRPAGCARHPSPCAHQPGRRPWCAPY